MPLAIPSSSSELHTVGGGHPGHGRSLLRLPRELPAGFPCSVAAGRLPEALGGWQHGRRDGQHERLECRPYNPGEGDVSLHKIKNSTLY